MKLIHQSTSCLLHLLLLAELFVHSSPRPALASPLCATFGSMIHQLDTLNNSFKKIHDLTEDELKNFDTIDHRLDSLPHVHHNFAHIRLQQANKSLSQLYADTRSFKLLTDWLKAAKENVSVSSQSVEGASNHLQRLSNLLKASLQQMDEEVPEVPPPSLPAVTTAFDALVLSVEMSDRLHVFCDWSKRVLRHVQRQACSRRH